MTQSDADDLVAKLDIVIGDAKRYRAERDRLIEAFHFMVRVGVAGGAGMETIVHVDATGYWNLLHTVEAIEAAP